MIHWYHVVAIVALYWGAKAFWWWHVG